MRIEKALELTKQAKTDNSKLIELEQLLTFALAEQMAKSKGGNTEKTRLTTAKKYIERCIKDLPFQKSAHGVWIENNIQYLTNTYSAFKFYKNHIKGVKIISEEIEKISVESFFPLNFSQYSKTEIPSITELKTQLKIAQTEAKANKIDLTSIPGSYIIVDKIKYNVKYLIECIEILGENTDIYIQKENETSVLWLKNDNGEAILCAIRPPKNKEISA